MPDDILQLRAVLNRKLALAVLKIFACRALLTGFTKPCSSLIVRKHEPGIVLS